MDEGNRMKTKGDVEVFGHHCKGSEPSRGGMGKSTNSDFFKDACDDGHCSIKVVAGNFGLTRNGNPSQQSSCRTWADAQERSRDGLAPIIIHRNVTECQLRNDLHRCLRIPSSASGDIRGVRFKDAMWCSLRGAATIVMPTTDPTWMENSLGLDISITGRTGQSSSTPT